MTAAPSSPTPPSTPPTPAPGPPAPKTRKPQKRGIWLFALAALVVSLLSLVVAVASLASARAARDDAADAWRLVEALSQGNTASPAPVANDPPATPTASEPPLTGSPPATQAPLQTLNPQAEFTVKYPSEVLNPQVTSSDDAYLDLDEPRVVFDSSAADIVIELAGLRSSPPYFDLGQSNVTAAEAGSANVTPEDCLQQIRTSPLPASAEVPAQRGTVLCILTSASRAAEQGISPKLVVLHVSALGDEGRVTIEAKAWEQPR